MQTSDQSNLKFCKMLCSYDKSSIKFFKFNCLPVEVKQMIVDRVSYDKPGKSRYDGRGLLNLRAVNTELKLLAEWTMRRERKCFKEKIYFAETYKSGQVRLGTLPVISKTVVRIEEFECLLAKLMLTGKKEIHIRCEFRKEWCDAVMEVLLRNEHIKPKLLMICGVTGRPELFHQYVAKNPSLRALIFEKPLSNSNFFKTPFMTYSSKEFYNLGPQDSLPENVRNAFNNRVLFTRELQLLKALRNAPSHECKF